MGGGGFEPPCLAKDKGLAELVGAEHQEGLAGLPTWVQQELWLRPSGLRGKHPEGLPVLEWGLLGALDSQLMYP